MKQIRKLISVLFIITIFVSIIPSTASAKELSEVVVAKNTREKTSVTIRYSNLSTKKVPETYEYKHPKTKEILTLRLVESNYSESVVSDREATVQGRIDYGWQSYIPAPLATIPVDYYDKGSLKTVHTKISFTKLTQKQDFRWLDDVVAEAIFEVYEAEYYKMKDHEIYIPYNEVMPEIKGQEKQIVEAMNENTEYLHLLSSRWDGAVYTEKGVSKRKAVFLGERYVAQYEATYLSQVALPDIPGYDCIATYSYDFIITEDPSPTSELEEPAVAMVEPAIESIAEQKSKSTSLTAKQTIMIAGGILLLAGLIVLILYVIKKHSRQKEYDEKDILLRRRSRGIA